jgi:hypothetical protein
MKLGVLLGTSSSLSDLQRARCSQSLSDQALFQVRLPPAIERNGYVMNLDKRLERLEKQVRRSSDVPCPSRVIVYIPDNGRDPELSKNSGPAVPGRARVIIYDPDTGIPDEHRNHQ